MIDGDRGLVKMEETAYDSEKLLQELLEKYQLDWGQVLHYDI